MKEYWVWCNAERNESDPEQKALLAKCREFAQGAAIVCAVFVSEQKPVTHGADVLRWCKADGSAVLKAKILAEMAQKYKPEIILFSANITDSHVAARTAALLDTGLSADCTELRMEDGVFIMHRPAFGGGVVADIGCNGKFPQMATVRPGTIKCEAEESEANYEIYNSQNLHEDPVKLLSKTIMQHGQSLSEAEIIVAGGLGVGSKEGFRLIEELAFAIGGEAGASRAAVDAGFASWHTQIGQTGTTVHPKLYLAFGISGSIQHIAGMHGAEFIAAVNNDPKAPIFDYCDLAVVADWHMVAKFLLQKFLAGKKRC